MPTNKEVANAVFEPVPILVGVTSGIMILLVKEYGAYILLVIGLLCIGVGKLIRQESKIKI